jgi:nitroimidazol reductase NimA-like FMN-containing flavoprotein (pyridoxamine 5'-phosphate oxidase superfamily)
MRRKDREVTDKEEIIQIIAQCDICRVAFSEENIPYIVPMNFGYEYRNGDLTLYFHGANKGKKLDIIKKNNTVCFEMDCSHKLIPAEVACNYSMEFESVIGNGKIMIITDEKEKIAALKFIMAKYSDRKDFQFEVKHVKAISVLKLIVTDYSGKRLKKSVF